MLDAVHAGSGARDLRRRDPATMRSVSIKYTAVYQAHHFIGLYIYRETSFEESPLVRAETLLLPTRSGLMGPGGSGVERKDACCKCRCRGR